MNPLKRFFYRAFFFAGWLLSPFTFWNDAFVNIPLSYLLASLFIGVVPCNFLTLTVIFYWASNGLGIILMAVAGGRLAAGTGKKKGGMAHELIALLLTVGAYTAILIAADRFGVLKPLRSFARF